jgi:hypothetical protein
MHFEYRIQKTTITVSTEDYHNQQLKADKTRKGYALDCQGSVLHIIQIGYEAHPGTYTMCTGSSFLGGEAAEA